MRAYQTGKNNPIKYSVTSILDATKPQASKDAIENWRLKVGEEKANEIRENGSKVHRQVEDFIDGNTVENPLKEFLLLKENLLEDLVTNKNILSKEQIVYSDKHQYAGRIDCLCKINFKPTILDWKTSTRKKKREWLDDYFVQTAAYAIAWEEMTDEKIHKLAIAIATKKSFQFFFEAELQPWKDKWLEKLDLFKKIISEEDVSPSEIIFLNF